MTEMTSLLEKSKTLALKEIEIFGAPNRFHFEIANRQGQILAEKLGADKEVVLLGTIFMDFKIGQAIKEGRLADHINMSADAAREFLKESKVDPNLVSQVVSCVLSHHATIPFASKEAEICANADCYRFLTFRGVISFVAQLGHRGMDLEGIIDYVGRKVEEKWAIVSLAEVKAELRPSYQKLKDFVVQAKGEALNP